MQVQTFEGRTREQMEERIEFLSNHMKAAKATWEALLRVEGANSHLTEAAWNSYDTILNGYVAALAGTLVISQKEKAAATS